MEVHGKVNQSLVNTSDHMDMEVHGKVDQSLMNTSDTWKVHGKVNQSLVNTSDTWKCTARLINQWWIHLTHGSAWQG